MNLLAAIDDPELFGSQLPLATWGAWRAFIAALFAYPMSADDLSLYKACTGRSEPPEKPFNEGWLICGRWAGKSLTMALIAVYLGCFRSYVGFLGPGERATIMVIAADRKQARVLMRYIRGLLANPILSKIVERETTDSFDLTNRVTIEIATASFKSVRGYTVVAALAGFRDLGRDVMKERSDIPMLLFCRSNGSHYLADQT